MLKRILVLIFVILSLEPANSQELNLKETIDYINDKLTNECPGHSGQINTPFDFAYNKFEINENGLLKIKYYFEDGTYVSHTDAYIKNIYVEDKLTEFDKSYYIKFKCKTNKCFTKTTVLDFKDYKGQTKILDSTKIRCTNINVSKKLHRAIKHLINIAEKKEEFYKKDPFSDS